MAGPCLFLPGDGVGGGLRCWHDDIAIAVLRIRNNLGSCRALRAAIKADFPA
jgi:hypothetical protein